MTPMRTFRSRFTAPLLAAAVAVTLSATALAHDYSLGSLAIAHPWAKASAGMAANGAAFLKISNSGQADRLISAQTPAADRAELHTHSMEGGVMKMRQVEAIDVPASGAVALEPGGLHVMLFGLKAPLKEKDRMPLTLTFEKAGSITVEVQVEALTATPEKAHKAH